MKILLAGIGSLGFQVASTLVENGHDIILMDTDPDALRDAAARLDCMTLVGRSNNLGDLLNAGAKTCSAFIAMTGSDEINIISCSLAAAEFPGITTIARVRNIEYGQGRLYQTLEAGIDHIINPETTAAVTILNSLVYGAMSDVISFQSMDIQVRTILIPVGSELHGKKLQEVHQSLTKPCLVPLINRRDTYLIPFGETSLMEGDHLYLAALSEDFPDIFESLGKIHKPLRKILILGSGRVALAVASYLVGINHLGGAEQQTPGLLQIFGRGKVKILEENYDRCKVLSEELPKALVIQGDISDETLFKEEQLGDNDVLVCCTEHEERNILAGLYGKRLGIRRAVSLVQSNNYLSIARQLDLDVAVSLKNAVASSIIRILRAGEAENVQSLGDGNIEILEFIISSASKADGKVLMSLDFPPETLVIGVERDNESFIARGATVLKASDRVIVLTRRQHASRVQNIFRNQELREA